MFGCVGEENMMLGAFTLCFNHHGDPNTALDFYGQPLEFSEMNINTVFCFSRIWSLRNISKDEEICISYGSKVSPIHHFVQEGDADPVVLRDVQILSASIIQRVCASQAGAMSKRLYAAYNAKCKL